MRKEFEDEYFTKEYIFDFDKKEVVKNDLSPRDRVKKVTFQIFFSKNKTPTKEKKLFKKLFPTVTSIFEASKAKKHVKIVDRHKQLAKALQRTESHVMLDKVAKEIARLKPGLTFFTIHDCIVTTVGNEDFVKEVMTRVITAEMGFPVTVEPQYWCKECSDLMKAA